MGEFIFWIEIHPRRDPNSPCLVDKSHFSSYTQGQKQNKPSPPLSDFLQVGLVPLPATKPRKLLLRSPVQATVAQLKSRKFSEAGCGGCPLSLVRRGDPMLCFGAQTELRTGLGAHLHFTHTRQSPSRYSATRQDFNCGCPLFLHNTKPSRAAHFWPSTLELQNKDDWNIDRQ